MCATAVLRSQDCLRKPYRQKPNNNSNAVSRSRRRKRSPTSSFDANLPDQSKRSPNNLLMGQVKILKRGEPLPDPNNNNNTNNQVPSSCSQTVTLKKLGFAGKSRDADVDDLVLCSTGRLGPEPELVQKQIRASDLYAGSCPVVSSPPPSSLPFPAFFSKKEKKFDEATSDLLRLLRLDLQPK